MSDWSPSSYLKFEKERSRPAIDLVSRINHHNPTSILDVGCGPGNSTRVLYDRWNTAKITGLDSSPTMLEKAKGSCNCINWVLQDASEDLSHLGKFDLVFSNAAFQWIPDIEMLISRLFNMLNQNGILAAQVPYVEEMTINKIITNLINQDKWPALFANLSPAHKMYEPEYYYGILCGLTQELYLWETRYFHLMGSHNDILHWYQSTGLRPYLNRLAEEEKVEFESHVLSGIKEQYKIQKDGKILFPFHRVFFIAYK